MFISLCQTMYSRSFVKGAFFLFAIGCARGLTNMTCLPGRDIVVQLFNWKWTDVERECERYLGRKGVCGVQVSPPIEHRVVRGLVDDRPWTERYEPVSYLVDSRSGTEVDFINMVRACHSSGVRIYPEVVLNNMVSADAGSGTGWAGSSYDADSLDFPAVPYNSSHFHTCGCGDCCSLSCDVEMYDDEEEVRNCRADSLLDLAHNSTDVISPIVEYLDTLVEIGVAGFVVHNGEYMNPLDLETIFDLVSPLNTAWFPPGTRPDISVEIVDFGLQAVNATNYTHLGQVSEYQYSVGLGDVFLSTFALGDLEDFGLGPAWGMMDSSKALVFVDNHINQRGIDQYENLIVTEQVPVAYDCAMAFALAWPYGTPRITSGYEFQSIWEGPPSYSDGEIADVPIYAEQGSCGAGWTCEHIRPVVSAMIDFHNVVGQAPVSLWQTWGNGSSIAFSRGNKGVIVINYDAFALETTVETGMPSGLYCDVISGNLVAGQCTGDVKYVDMEGYMDVFIAPRHQNPQPIVAIHQGSLLEEITTTELVTDINLTTDVGLTTDVDMTTDIDVTTDVNMTTDVYVTTDVYMTTEGDVTTVSPLLRTVVFVEFASQPGEDLFLRGGLSDIVIPECAETPELCYIPLSHNPLGSGSHYEKMNAWAVGDSFLDWDGAEPGQGDWEGVPADGTPSVWTTDETAHPGYQPLNTFGPNHWMVDIDLDCSQTVDGWIEFKGFINTGGWEGDISQDATCAGSVGGSAPYQSNNHMARCGYLNLFTFNSGSCTIDVL